MSTSWSDWASASSGAGPRSPASRLAVRAGLGGVLLALWGVSAPAAGPAQQARELDAGSFRITPGQGATVTETFAIRREGDTYQSAARITSGTTGEPGTGRSLREFRLQLDAGLLPTFFELTDRSGQELGIVGVRSGNRLQLRARTPDGERWQELLLTPGLAVLPEGLAHPYFFVARMLEDGAAGPFPVVLPGEGERRSLTVEGRARDTVDVGGARLPADRMDFRIGDGLRRVWIDDRGRVLRVEIPDRGWSAVRAAAPGGD